VELVVSGDIIGAEIATPAARQPGVYGSKRIARLEHWRSVCSDTAGAEKMRVTGGTRTPASASLPGVRRRAFGGLMPRLSRTEAFARPASPMEQGGRPVSTRRLVQWFAVPAECWRHRVSRRDRSSMITAGSILMEKEARHPPFFQLQDDGHPSAWMSVSYELRPRELATALSTAGWTFFYMASPIRKRAFGFDRPKAIQEALKRVILRAKGQGCNCIEVDGVELRSMLGIPYVSVSAHARHLQKGPFFIRS
jgi:hypothetical protein